MTNFKQREEAFEAKFARDEEREFKAQAHAMRLLGLWAAERCGLSGAIAERYTNALVDAEVGPKADQALEKVIADLSKCGIDAKQVYAKRDELLALALGSADDGGSPASKA